MSEDVSSLLRRILHFIRVPECCFSELLGFIDQVIHEISSRVVSTRVIAVMALHLSAVYPQPLTQFRISHKITTVIFLSTGFQWFQCA